MKKYNYRSQWNKLRAFNLKIGFLVSISFVFFAFQLNVEVREPIVDETDTDVPHMIDNMPITRQQQKKTPPVKINEKKETINPLEEFIIDEDDGLEENDDFDDQEVFESDYIEDNEVMSSTEPAPMVKRKEIHDDEPFIYIAHMPAFGDCNLLTEEERKACSDMAILSFIKKNLRYPKHAIDIGLEGTVYAEFIISKTGKIKALKIVRGLGAGTDTEVLRVLNKMPMWSPGKQNFRPVNVKIVIPIKFQLN